MISKLAVPAACLAMAQSVAFAQEPAPVPLGSPGAPYVGLGGALSILQNIHVHPMDFPQSPGRAQERFKIGGAGAAVAGYAFGNGFQVEVEGAYEFNDINKLSPVSPPGKQTGNQQSYGAFINGEYVIDLPSMGMDIGFVKPYVGLGVGVLWTHATLPAVLGNGFAVHHIGGTSGPNFAAQSILGLVFPIPAVPGLAAFTQYNFVGIPDPTVLKSNFYTSSGLSKGNIKLSPEFLHLFVVGVAYAFGSPPPPPPATPVPVASPPVQPTRTYLVFFDWDRADLTDRARQIVAEAAAASTRVQTTRIEVNGYTDLSGAASYNQGLSVRRAKTVQAELVRDGVPAGEITVQGFGESNPLVHTAAGVREPQNRRVQVILR